MSIEHRHECTDILLAVFTTRALQGMGTGAQSTKGSPSLGPMNGAGVQSARKSVVRAPGRRRKGMSVGWDRSLGKSGASSASSVIEQAA
jgi:hypothetical protein